VAELRLEGATVVLTEDALEQLVDQVADRLGAQRDCDGWIRGAAAAAEYLGCKPKRIYDLKAQDLLEYRKEGSRLSFRREWLDAAMQRGSR
jgi:hypothetical protein